MGDKVMHWGLGWLYLVDIREEVSQRNWVCGQIWLEMKVKTSSGWLKLQKQVSEFGPSRKKARARSEERV